MCRGVFHVEHAGRRRKAYRAAGAMQAHSDGAATPCWNTPSASGWGHRSGQAAWPPAARAMQGGPTMNCRSLLMIATCVPVAAPVAQAGDGGIIILRPLAGGDGKAAFALAAHADRPRRLDSPASARASSSPASPRASKVGRPARSRRRPRRLPEVPASGADPTPRQHPPGRRAYSAGSASTPPAAGGPAAPTAADGRVLTPVVAPANCSAVFADTSRSVESRKAEGGVARPADRTGRGPTGARP